MLRPAIAIAVTFGSIAQVAADAPKNPDRPAHYGAGIGGYYAITGPSQTGLAAQLELSPGGAFGRFGARAEARWFDSSSGYATAGITFEAGASRPRLVLALHAELGLAFDELRPVAGGGLHTQLVLLGPVALGFDSTVTLVYDGIDSSLILGTAATLRLAR